MKSLTRTRLSKGKKNGDFLHVNREHDNVKAYKRLILAVELVKFFKEKGEYWVTQDQLISEMVLMGFSRSYTYQRLKRYSQGIVKNHFKEDKPDILEPLLIEKARQEFDGICGTVYKLNDDWKDVGLDEIKEAFYGN